MTGPAEHRRRRTLTALALLAAPSLLVGAAAAVAAAFGVGLATGLMAVGTAVLVYQVPAVLFDWPRITFEHVLVPLGYLAGRAASLLRSAGIVAPLRP